jgi:hypothetical protein
VPNLQRHRTIWSGIVGGPGVTTLYWDASTAPNLGAWNTFLTAIVSRFPIVLTWQSQNSGDVLDDASGRIIGAWNGTAQAAVNGTAAGGYSAPSGAVVNWRSSGIVAGHRVRGRTFLVPTTGAVQDTDGSISSAALGTLRTALGTFVAAAAPSLMVWHRPVNFAGGSSFPVTSADIPDKSAILRSRRD